MPPTTMRAKPARIPRHRPGVAVADSESSEPEASEDESPSESTEAAPPLKSTIAGGITGHLKDINLDERRRIALLKESARVEEENKIKAQEEEGFVTESNESSEDSSENDESGEEESSEEEAPRRMLLRPTFIKKEKRHVHAEKNPELQTIESQVNADERKKIAVDEIVEEQIKKDLAAKAAGKKYWDDDEIEDIVDDTDGINPAAEYAEWELRELKRIKREREEIEEKEKEIAEIERRRNLSVEERVREDNEYVSKQKEEKEGKNKMSFMRKYYHKGAFYQEEARSEGLLQRDIMGAKIQDEVDRETLPKYLQQRDLTKVGKKGATKYRDLKTEDTGHWGQFSNYKSRQDGPRDFYSDERFKPDRERPGSDATGANSLSVSSRKMASRSSGPMRPTKEERGRDMYRRERDYSSPSRSRSSRRDRELDVKSRRKRSTSRDAKGYDNEKRRRM
ncbi:Microfibrillar-associated protein 1 [Golovinomyces cichoracearum]|uniref:Microfibrillar-associated protein 1 n=1 Tax=Golovinomyces cichoracearum TaxID=62708 RepID=A0A420IJZ7_9PEZI|nr:Microfibrillar-associated protein 1 [Golovinomyces cichoracearum]